MNGNATATPRLAPRRRGHRPAAWALLLGGALLMPIAAGCRTPEVKQQERRSGALEQNSFRTTWRASVDTAAHGAVDRVFLRDDLLLVYTRDNVVYCLSADSGQTRFIANDVVGPRDRLLPPALVDAQGRLGPNIARVICFPSGTSYILYTDDGRRVQVTPLQSAFTSPSAVSGGQAYAGLADPYGGRVARMDPTRQVAAVLQPTQVRGSVISRPAVWQSTLYAGDQEGHVYAITPSGAQAWNRPSFQTNRGISADLAVDDFGLYVPSLDSTFYVLDRGTGRLKWRHFADVPLYRPAVPTERLVFLPVESKGVLCFSKTEGASVNRDPIWVADKARDFLSDDERRVYLLNRDGHIVAHDKESGEALFRSEASDFTSFARGKRGTPRIYAARGTGEIVAIDPVLSRGQVGEVAMLAR